MLTDPGRPHPTLHPRKKAKLTHQYEMEMDNLPDAVW